ncbi:N-acetylneuraminate synthase [Exiguobacterium undae]
MKNKTYIIAEAGVNHNGCIIRAFSLIDAAVNAKADAVKFQTFTTENLVTKKVKQARYQIDNIGKETTQFEMLKKLELSHEEFVDIKAYCDKKEIEFLSTPFDYESVDFLIDQIGMTKIKISSGDLTDTPLIHYIATKRVPIILSTGMAKMEEIHEALSFISYGLARPEEDINIESVSKFYETLEAKKWLKKYVTVLHCTTEYPAPYEDINLRAINFMENELDLTVGLSDHSEGIHIPIAAVARNVKIIEKHLTISRKLPGPDHFASLEPNEFLNMVKAIRQIECALGKENKEPTLVEKNNQMATRKSLVASKKILKGEIFTKENLAIKRSEKGLSPSFYWTLLNSIALENYEEDDLING